MALGVVVPSLMVENAVQPVPWRMAGILAGSPAIRQSFGFDGCFGDSPLEETGER